MVDHIDTGFEAALAGEKWVEPEITVTVTTPPPPHACGSTTGSTRCDTCFGPLEPNTSSTTTLSPTPSPSPTSSPSSGNGAPSAPTILPQSLLTPAGVQAAKALVQLPASLDWPTMSRLAREIAMDIKERHTILKDFGLTEVQYEFLEGNNEFYRSALASHCRDWHAPLSTAERIKVEAAAILEDSLLGLGARMQNKGEGLPGVIEAAKLFAKVAGVGEQERGALPAGERFTINIDLGADQKITVGVETSTTPALGNSGAGPVSADPKIP